MCKTMLFRCRELLNYVLHVCTYVCSLWNKDLKLRKEIEITWQPVVERTLTY